MEYQATVNKSDLNMNRFTGAMNSHAYEGWRVKEVLEQNGNTVTIYERGDSPEAVLLRQLITEQQRTNQLLEWMGAKVPAVTS